jgi:hypothetical protein
MSDDKGGKQQHSLEERIRSRSEKRRRKAAESLPPSLLVSVLESSPMPILVYEDSLIWYANPAAIERFGYRYEEILTFNDAMLDTGTRKERLETILGFCDKVGWNDLDLELSIPTLDRKELRITPHLHRVDVYGRSFWIAYLLDVQKINPHTFKGRAHGAWQRMQRAFQSERVYFRAPVHLTRQEIEPVVQSAAKTGYNLVIDLKDTKTFDDKFDGIKLLRDFDSSFEKRLFLVNADEMAYTMLAYNGIAAESIYRMPKLSPSPA